MSFVTLNNVTYVKGLPSGKASVVEYGGKEYVIPHFAISDDSDINADSAKGDCETLILRDDIAMEKGMIEGGTGSTGGIPLKRNKLPPPPDLMATERRRGIHQRWAASSAADKGWAREGSEIYEAGPEALHKSMFVGMFEKPLDAEFVAHAPDDIVELLIENKHLRAWMEEAKKKFNARRKRK